MAAAAFSRRDAIYGVRGRNRKQRLSRVNPKASPPQWGSPREAGDRAPQTRRLPRKRCAWSVPPPQEVPPPYCDGEAFILQQKRSLRLCRGGVAGKSGSRTWAEQRINILPQNTTKKPQFVNIYILMHAPSTACPHPPNPAANLTKNAL